METKWEREENTLLKWSKGAGLDSPLQLLYLGDCSIPSDTLQEILKSLKKCKQLTYLDLGGHNLKNDGEHLVELIKSFGIGRQLQQLHLQDCSMQEKECTEMLKYLSEYRHITQLNLNGNRVGKGGTYIVEMVQRAGLDSPLQLLYLRDCSIPSDSLREILKCLKKCEQLTDFGLGGHNLENNGSYFVELFETTEVDPPLQQLYLPKCSIPEVEGTDILSFQCLYLDGINMARHCNEHLLGRLDKCKNLVQLSLNGNKLTGQLQYFLSRPNSTLPSLSHLDLGNVGLNREDVNHLKTLLESGRMPALGGPDNTQGLFLDRNNLADMVDEVENLLDT